MTASKETKAAEQTAVGDFQWTTAGIPHTLRRRLILEKYPEVEKLYGHDIGAGLFATGLIVVQLLVASWIYYVDASWWIVVLLACVISASCIHALFAGMHELSHCLFWPERWMNQWFGILSNVVMGVPAAISFWRYHLDHHVFFGVDGLDPDIPTAFEGWLFQSTLGKFIFIALLPATYTLRPLFRRPKKMFAVDVANWLIIITTDFLILIFFGMKPFMYFIIGTLFGMSFHPFAGHLIAEHYQFPYGEPFQETYSYYGFMNWMCFNVGYHIEHHDFPNISGKNLPLLRKMAPEFYDLPEHRSWIEVVWNFIFTPGVSPLSRVKRWTPRGGKLPPHHKCGHDGAAPNTLFWCADEKLNPKGLEPVGGIQQPKNVPILSKNDDKESANVVQRNLKI